MEAYLGHFFNVYGLAWLVIFLIVFPFLVYMEGWGRAVRATAFVGVSSTLIILVMITVYYLVLS